MNTLSCTTLCFVLLRLGSAWTTSRDTVDFFRSFPRGTNQHQPNATNPDYREGLAILAAPTLIAAVVIIIVVSIFLICRICCHCCGGRSSWSDGYSKWSRLTPFFVLSLFSIGMVIVSSFGFHENDTLSRQIRDITRSSISILSLANLTISPPISTLTQLGQQLGPTIHQIKAVSLNSSSLRAQTGHLIGGLDRISDGLGQFPNHGYTCQFCSTAAQVITLTNIAIQLDAISALDQADRTISLLGHSVVSNSGPAVAKISAVESDLQSNRDDIVDLHGQLPRVYDYDQSRYIELSVLYSLPIVILFTSCAAVVFRSGLLFRLVFLVSFLSILISLTTFSLYFPLGAATADICSSNITALAPQSALPIVSACVGNTSLLVALNASDQLAFRDQVHFDNLNISLSFSALNTLSSQSHNLTLQSAFAFDSLRIDTMLNDFSFNTSFTNSSGVPIYNRVSIYNETGSPGSAGPGARSTYRQAITNLIDVERDLNRTLAAIQGNVSSISSEANFLSSNASNYVANLTLVAKYTIPLLNLIDELRAQSYCGAMMPPIDRVMDTVCSSFIDSIYNTCLFTFAIALLTIPPLILSVTLWKRTPRFARDNNLPSAVSQNFPDHRHSVF